MAEVCGTPQAPLNQTSKKVSLAPVLALEQRDPDYTRAAAAGVAVAAVATVALDAAAAAAAAAVALAADWGSC